MAKEQFFSRLNYSFGNEDWKVEQKALQIKNGDKVLCITASGDRPLHLLLDDCEKLTSVDANPVQNHLLHLKCSAMNNLGFEEYLGFLGAISCDKREASFQKVLKNLNPESANFWINHPKKIRKGVIYQGDIERLTKLVAFTTKLFRPAKVKKLFEIDNLEEQKEFVRTEWDTFAIRKTFETLLSKSLSRVLALLSIDPGLHSHVAPTISLGTYIYDRMIESLSNCLAKENLLISLIFRGFVGVEGFPPYLRKEGFEHIKEKLNRLDVKTDNVITHLENVPKESYNCFSLSDIASYMDQSSFDQMIMNIYRAAKPGARFCMRQFSSNHQFPAEFTKNFVREPALEQILEKQDCCFVYRFMVGNIEK